MSSEKDEEKIVVLEIMRVPDNRRVYVNIQMKKKLSFFLHSETYQYAINNKQISEKWKTKWRKRPP